MIQKVRTWAMASTGIILIISALILFILSKLGRIEYELSWFEMIGLVLVGWLLLFARKKLLERLVNKIFSIK